MIKGMTNRRKFTCAYLVAGVAGFEYDYISSDDAIPAVMIWLQFKMSGINPLQ